jgi:hypothetical protein
MLITAACCVFSFIFLSEKYSGEWHWVNDYSEIPGDYGLQMASAGKLHAIAAPVAGGINIKDQTLVVQFEVELNCF